MGRKNRYSVAGQNQDLKLRQAVKGVDRKLDDIVGIEPQIQKPREGLSYPSKPVWVAEAQIGRFIQVQMCQTLKPRPKSARNAAKRVAGEISAKEGKKKEKRNRGGGGLIN